MASCRPTLNESVIVTMPYLLEGLFFPLLRPVTVCKSLAINTSQANGTNLRRLAVHELAPGWYSTSVRPDRPLSSAVCVLQIPLKLHATFAPNSEGGVLPGRVAVSDATVLSTSAQRCPLLSLIVSLSPCFCPTGPTD